MEAFLVSSTRYICCDSGKRTFICLLVIAHARLQTRRHRVADDDLQGDDVQKSCFSALLAMTPSLFMV